MSFFKGVFSQETLARPSARVLIAVNLSMIAGVVYLGWSVLDIVFLYWVENLVVGLINVFRMVVSSPELGAIPDASEKLKALKTQGYPEATAMIRKAGTAVKLFMIPFFIIHYGGFCYGHGVFVLAMFGDGGMMGASGESGHSPGFFDLLTPEIQFAILVLAASHFYSFIKNFLHGGEYKRTHAAMLMMRPYGRIVALHITILFGAFLTMVLDSPMGLLVILVVMKTIADLGLHQIERKKLGPAQD
jgi:hypothetical protein